MTHNELMEQIALLCDERAEMHDSFLPDDFGYTMGDHAQAATCGRRDECKVIADMVRRLKVEEDK